MRQALGRLQAHSPDPAAYHPRGLTCTASTPRAAANRRSKSTPGANRRILRYQVAIRLNCVVSLAVRDAHPADESARVPADVSFGDTGSHLDLLFRGDVNDGPAGRSALANKERG